MSENEAPVIAVANIGATFICDLCGGPAGTVQVVRPGRPTLLPPNMVGAPPWLETMLMDSYGVVVREHKSFTLLGDEGERHALASEDVLGGGTSRPCTSSSAMPPSSGVLSAG